MIDYASLVDTADSLIQEFGAQATLTKIIKGSYSAATSSITTTEETHTIQAVKLSFKQFEVDGEIIKTSDVKFLISSKDLAVTIETGDKITFNSVEFSVQNVMEMAPAGTTVYFKVQARK